MTGDSKKDQDPRIIEKKLFPDFKIPSGLIGESGDNGGSGVAVLNLEDQPGFDRLDSFQIFAAKLALVSLQLAEGFGYIDFAKVKRIADFGPGSGGSTFALTTIARALGATAVTVAPSALAIVVKANVEPPLPGPKSAILLTFAKSM